VVLSEPSSVRFQSQEEFRFFQLYVTKTSNHLSGFYGPILWNQIVLQASEMEESIRHAVISIGALDMTMVSGHNAGRKTVPPEAEASHVFALKQYSKAINSLQQKVFNPAYDLRTALVASILIVCFEQYHGNYESAHRQTRTAVRLIEDSTSTPTDDSKGQDVEQELLRAFDRLDIQSMSHTDPFTLSEHLSLKDSNAALLSPMPQTFPNVAEARNYFNIMARQTVHFGCAFWAAHSTPTPSPPSPSEAQSPMKPSLSYFDTARPGTHDFEMERNQRLDDAEAFFRSFLPMFNQHRKNPGSKECLAVSALRIHFLVMVISLRNLGSQKEMSWDVEVDGFREIVELSEDCLFPPEVGGKGGKGKEVGGEYVFDLQTVMPLDLTAKKCRDPVVRRDAIRLLRSRPRREGFWDSVVAARVCEWVVGIEEEGLEEGKGGAFVREVEVEGEVVGFKEEMVAWGMDAVSEERRVRGVGVKLEPEGGSAKVWCKLGTGERREGVVYW
jgi:hypothetical protein